MQIPKIFGVVWLANRSTCAIIRTKAGFVKRIFQKNPDFFKMHAKPQKFFNARHTRQGGFLLPLRQGELDNAHPIAFPS